MAFKILRWFHSCILGKVESDGYQYCIQCGRAHLPPPKKCHHLNLQRVTTDWEKNPSERWTKKGTFVLQCKDCGDIIQRDIF